MITPDIIQIVRDGRVIHSEDNPLFAWIRGKRWHLTKVHIMTRHGRSNCGQVDLRHAKRSTYRVSRQRPVDALTCMKCNHYGQWAPYGA